MADEKQKPEVSVVPTSTSPSAKPTPEVGSITHADGHTIYSHDQRLGTIKKPDR